MKGHDSRYTRSFGYRIYTNQASTKRGRCHTARPPHLKRSSASVDNPRRIGYHPRAHRTCAPRDSGPHRQGQLYKTPPCKATLSAPRGRSEMRPRLRDAPRARARRSYAKQLRTSAVSTGGFVGHGVLGSTRACANPTSSRACHLPPVYARLARCRQSCTDARQGLQ